MRHKKRWQPHRQKKPCKKAQRGNSRQVLKMELRNLTFGREEENRYGDVGVSAAGAGRYDRFAA